MGRPPHREVTCFVLTCAHCTVCAQQAPPVAKQQSSLPDILGTAAAARSRVGTTSTQRPSGYGGPEPQQDVQDHVQMQMNMLPSL